MKMEFVAANDAIAEERQAGRADPLRVRRAQARRVGRHEDRAGRRRIARRAREARSAQALSDHDRTSNHLVARKNPFLIGLATLLLIAGGIVAILRTPLDALPDLSDVQVIVYTEVPGQAPQVVEDQVTYPLTTAMLSVPHSKVVRGFSFFGASFVYIIFEDGTDIYWARSRVLEYLNVASQRLPRGRHAAARSRRDRRRLGVPVRRARARTARSRSCARCRTGTCATS